MKLSNTRITANHTTGMNVWGEHSFQVSFPKEITFEGVISSDNFISNTVMVSVEYLSEGKHVSGSTVNGSVVGNIIRLGSKGVKGNTTSNYNGETLMLVVRNRNGELIHKQSLNKVAKVKDAGNFKG